MAETPQQQRQRARTDALSLAVETVKNARNFTNFQVVHTAALYESYIWDGTVPPRTEAPRENEEVVETGDDTV